jgi:hypothetical protein
MTTFTIDTDNNITAHGTPEEAATTTATPFDTFTSQQELAELVAGWPAERLVAIWNSLPGVTPVKKFKDRSTAATLIWKRIQNLGESVKPEPAQPVQPKAAGKAKGGAKAAQGASTKGKATKKATAAKNAPRANGPPRRRKPARRARAVRQPRWWRCSSGRTEPLWPRSWKKWDGNGIPSAGLWPAR